MTKIDISVKNIEGKYAITWLEQKGDELPDELWTKINIALRKAVEGYNK